VGGKYEIDFAFSLGYSVIVEDGGYGSTADPNPANAGEPVTLNAGNREGHTLTGWTVSSATGGVPVSGNSFEMPASDVTATATWTANLYNIMLNLNGGSGSQANPATAKFADTVTLDPGTKEGHDFAGWTVTSTTGSVPVSDNSFTMPASNVTATANWKIKTFTVKFNSNGGSAIADEKVDHGNTVARPDDPTLTGRILEGWYSNSGFTTKYDFDLPVTGDITLYARWLVPDGFVLIPGGKFMMGSPTGGNVNERPVREVTLSAFYMDKYQVTQKDYMAVMESNPSRHQGSAYPPADGEVQERRPVEKITWYMALVYANKLSMIRGLSPAYRIDGSTDPADWGTPPITNDVAWNNATVVAGSTGYRLPTEAQWEYAARGGNGSPGNFLYAGSNAIDDVAWYVLNSGNKTHEVGKKAENGLGLYDMSGNVWEWTWDWYGTYPNYAQTDPTGSGPPVTRSVRGGSYSYNSNGYVRSAFRGYTAPFWQTNHDYGIRLVRPAE